MRAINLIFEVNYGAFAIFAALLITEIMGSVLLLIAWDETRKRVLDYVVPIWEITGTFGALWVVTGYFAYPALLVPVAAIFGPLLVIFLILFVARNASIVFGEFIVGSRRLDEVRLYKAYAVSTVLLGLVVLVLLSALVGGQGVNLTAGSFSLVHWATPGSLFFIAGTLALAVGLAPAFFNLEPLRRLVLPFTAVGVILSVLSYFAMSSALLTGWMAIPVALTLLVGVLYLWPRTSRIVSNKAVFIAALAVVIFSLQPLIYPKVIGQALSIDAVTTSGVLSSTFLSITVGGWLLLALMLFLYMTVASRGTSGPETAN